MIDYQREQQQTIPVEQVKIVGVGGAGANMLDRVALNGVDASTMLALNTDQRTLNTAMAGEKVQMGSKLTMGLGAGGDPEIGLRAAQEVETEIRDALRNQKIVFVCVGLGGGTGSGAAPLVTRIAREQGAFVVVFATMPFAFEGKRRLSQAETALNELSVLSNALVTFDNTKMGELILANQGIHEAFSAADTMISQSIAAVTRLVVKPGIINIGLDDLVSALKATKSRCLFGSGIASGENRSQQALKNALSSPLLDKGALLKSATTVLVHICGGPGMSLYEVELLMRELSKNVPESAHVLFGAAVDDSMGDELSVTLISALPENLLLQNEPSKKAEDSKAPEQKTPVVEEAAKETVKVEETPQSKPEAEEPAKEEDSTQIVSAASTQEGKVVLESMSFSSESTAEVKEESLPLDVEHEEVAQDSDDSDKEEDAPQAEEAAKEESKEEEESLLDRISSSDQKPQTELALDGGPKGKFSGETPNVVDGEDLDVPAFLRNR